MGRAKRSKEERQAWYRKMRDLSRTVDEMDPEERAAEAARLGTITAEGHELSANNCVYLMRQAGRPLRQVGGFRQWQRVGRHVMGKQKAVGYIWVRMGGRKATDGEEDEKPKFRLAPVWDVTQTAEIPAEEKVETKQ